MNPPTRYVPEHIIVIGLVNIFQRPTKVKHESRRIKISASVFTCELPNCRGTGREGRGKVVFDFAQGPAAARNPGAIYS